MVSKVSRQASAIILAVALISIVSVQPKQLRYTLMQAMADDADLVVEVRAEPSDEMTVEVLNANYSSEVVITKRILIYHTHTYEAYQQEEGSTYTALEKWRTKDDAHNVIAVGRALCASLQSFGFSVTHDTTAFEPPTLNDAYERSLRMLEERQQAGEEYDLYIDLHRDALASNSSIKHTVRVGETDIARFMVLIGQGTTGGYEEKPDWLTNKAYADKITKSLNDHISGLARDVKIKTGRFNQHVDDCCILIECGTNWNTLQEVINGVPYLAQAIHDALMTK